MPSSRLTFLLEQADLRAARAPAGLLRQAELLLLLLLLLLPLEQPLLNVVDLALQLLQLLHGQGQLLGLELPVGKEKESLESCLRPTDMAISVSF